MAEDQTEWDPDELHRLYWKEGLTYVQIADHYGVSKHAIQYQFDKHDIPRYNDDITAEEALNQLED